MTHETRLRGSYLPDSCERRIVAKSLLWREREEMESLPAALAVGSLTHKTLEVAITASIEGDDDDFGSIRVINQMAEDAFDDSDVGQGNTEMTWDSTTSSPTDMIEQAGNMAFKVLRDVPEILERRDWNIEERIESTGLLSGTPDLINEGATRILDFKTGRFHKGQYLQLGAYGFIATKQRLREHKPVDGAYSIIEVDRKKAKKLYEPAKLHTINANIAIQDARVKIQRINSLLKSDYDIPDIIARSIPEPGTFTCGAKWCDYHGTDYCPITKEDQS